MKRKDMPPEVRQIHDLLLRAQRHGIRAWLIYKGMRPGSEEGRLWYRWIKRGVANAHKAFGQPTPEETSRFILSEIRRSLRKEADLHPPSLRGRP